MAPLCSDPRQIVINFEPARRKAFRSLVDDITNHMLTQMEATSGDFGPVDTDNTPKSSGTSTPQGGEKPNQQQQPPKPSGKAAKKAAAIKEAAIKSIVDWKMDFMPSLEEIVRAEDTDKIIAERKKRNEEMKKREVDTAKEGEDLMNLGEAPIQKSEDFFSLQMLYHPIPNRLTGISLRDRKEALSCMLLLLLSTGKYSAHSRVLALYLASALELPQSFVIKEETEIANTLMESSNTDEKQKEATMSAEAEADKRRQENKFGRFWKVGLASVAGAAVIGVTGGLAAPLVAGALGGVLGGIGLGGVASFLGIFWMNGALVGALFGAYGAKMTGEMMDNYAKEVEDFKFIPLQEEWGKSFKDESSKEKQSRRLRLTIGINGWLNEESDVIKPWRVLSAETEVFALRYELTTLINLGTAFRELVKSAAWNTFRSEVIKRTVFATLWAALWPIQVLGAASKVDNPFSRGLNRSRKAGELLADALINRVQGERPVTLIGYSLGATAIHACLRTLAERHAFGLIESVVIIGAPAPAAPSHWRTLRTVVSGKIFNVYSENDMVLGFTYRMYTLNMGIAGLQPIKDVEGIENLDLSDFVSGHLRYPELTGEILRKCGFIAVKASKEIEKDEVIRMKDDYAEGKLVDFDGSEATDEKAEGENLAKTDEQKRAKEESQRSPMSEASEELRGLTISPPALSPDQKKADDSTVGLPPPPVEKVDDEEKPELPARPRKQEDAQAPKQEPATTRPMGTQTEVSRPLTPGSNASDDKEYKAISMVSNDSP